MSEQLVCGAIILEAKYKPTVPSPQLLSRLQAPHELEDWINIGSAGYTACICTGGMTACRFTDQQEAEDHDAGSICTQVTWNLYPIQRQGEGGIGLSCHHLSKFSKWK